MNFKTIRQTAATGILPEFRMRQLLKQGKLPGIYSGTRYLVNVDALEEQLKAETEKSMHNSPKHEAEPAGA